MRRKKRASSSSFMDGPAAAERSHSHRSAASAAAAGSEFFICFTSRPSAASSSAAPATSAARGPPLSSSSKSLLSPGRGRDPAPPSLSASLSRRLRSSGSVKGAQSPMFPAVVAAVAGGGGERRKGCSFEAAEPSSPKVTCIGQVRVKSKKKKKAAAAAAVAMAARSRSRRAGSRGEASFRRTEEFEVAATGKECLPSKNQRWVYQLPVSICEALKAFGSEFSCFFPCGGRSFCSNSSHRSAGGRELEHCGDEAGGEKRSATSSSSCGAVIARWLMAIQDGEEGKRGEVVSLVVEERRDREMEVVIKERLNKRDLDLDLESKMERRDRDKILEIGDEEDKGEMKEVEEARVSICIPPPNALLLMRCRSDPVRMAALASRFWDSPAMKVHIEKGREENREVAEEQEEENDGNAMLEEEFGQADEAEDAGLEGVTSVVVPEAKEEPTEVDWKKKTTEGIAQVDNIFDANGSEGENEVVEQQKKTGEDWLDEKRDPVEGTSACSLRMQRNPSEDQEEVAEAGAKAEISGLMESAEDKDFADQVKLLEREEKNEEEVDRRRSSSCSSTMDKEDRRSSKCLPRAKESGRRRSFASREKDRRRHSISAEQEVRRPSFGNEREARRSSFSVESKKRWSFCIEADELRLETKAIEEEEEEEKKKKEQESSRSSPGQNQMEEAIEVLNSKSTEEALEHPKPSEERAVAIARGGTKEDCRREEWESTEHNRERSNELPDCLLLMMYEPKLSMEVSKETWVCSTDFLRWHPHHGHHRPHPQGDGVGTGGELSEKEPKCEFKGNEDLKGMEETAKEQAEHAVKPPTEEHAPKPPTEEAPSLEKLTDDAAAPVPTAAAAAAAAAALPSTLAPAPPYGPFVLTRCKSEPMRSSARLAPDACFWRDRHRPIGATGIGF